MISMTEDQWRQSDDLPLMLEWFRQQWQGEEAALDRLLRRYLLACCRRIWRLLPLEMSRRAVRTAERDLQGKSTRDEVIRARCEAEAAAFFLESSDDRNPSWLETPGDKESWLQYEARRRALVERLVKDVEAIPPEELQHLVGRSGDDVPDSPRRLLESAAFFVDASLRYPGPGGMGDFKRYQRFLPASLLRAIVGNPFRGTSPASA